MNYRLIRFLVVLFFVSGFIAGSHVQAQKVKAGVIAFYNLENLFDTIDTHNVLDTEFTPESPKLWNSDRYWKKIDHMASVIAQLGSHEKVAGPAVIGLSEMENRAVLEDLVNSPRLRDLNYQIIHYDSPDLRGIDVALLYQPRYFTVTNTRSVPLIIHGEDGERIYTRDQLQVSGLFDGEPMHFIVNHWPSRRGDSGSSANLRNAAARLTRSLVDSIAKEDNNAKVIVMGDLNDDPTNESVRLYLKARDDQNRLKNDQMFNALGTHFKRGIGSLAYRDQWNLFDQIILSQSLLDNKHNGYHYHSSRVFNESFLVQQEGRYKGYPFRFYAGNNYLGGYSDHFPVYILLVKEVKE